MTKFIFLTGGVISSLGKGTTAASLGALFIARGIKTTAIKIDGYLNVDAGLMSPYEHGEVFVTDDGAETDCDIGHYERFLHSNLTEKNNLTSGKIYISVLDKERKGYYLGKTVQIVPHVSNEIMEWIRKTSEGFELAIVELGGVAGDNESIPFIDAMRQIWQSQKKDSLFVHLALVPFIDCLNEYKTKPLQLSVRDLLSRGIQPELIICRTKGQLTNEQVSKISTFTNVDIDCIFYSPDVKIKYEVIQILKDQGTDLQILKKLQLEDKYKTINFDNWNNYIISIKERKCYPLIKLALVRKYITNSDNYVSLIEALNHAAIYLKLNLEIIYIDSDSNDLIETLANVNVILVPGGWGNRGVEGKISAVKYARENNIPYLGICYGFQVACIEFARNVLKLDDCHSQETNPECQNMIIREIKNVLQQEADDNEVLYKIPKKLRVGSRIINVKNGTQLKEIYGKEQLKERFRHRYSFNVDYKNKFEEKGFIFSATNDQDEINTQEVFELPCNDFFMGVQYHPEFQSRPFEPNPLFVKFLKIGSKKILNKE